MENITEANLFKDEIVNLVSQLVGENDTEIGKFIHEVKDLISPVYDQSSPRQGGCNDPFAIFGFLAFLLVLLQLLANNGGGRRRRSVDMSSEMSSELCGDGNHALDDIEVGKLAIKYILQGFLKTTQTGSFQCQQRTFCEATKKAAGLGDIGATVSQVVSGNAPLWLVSGDVKRRRQLTKSGLSGIMGHNCSDLYHCHKGESDNFS